MSDQYVPHSHDDDPDDPTQANGPHGSNTEDEMNVDDND